MIYVHIKKVLHVFLFQKSKKYFFYLAESFPLSDHIKERRGTMAGKGFFAVILAISQK